MTSCGLRRRSEEAGGSIYHVQGTLLACHWRLWTRWPGREFGRSVLPTAYAIVLRHGSALLSQGQVFGSKSFAFSSGVQPRDGGWTKSQKPESGSCLCHWAAIWPWTSHPSLGLRSPTGESGAREITSVWVCSVTVQPCSRLVTRAVTSCSPRRSDSYRNYMPANNINVCALSFSRRLPVPPVGSGLRGRSIRTCRWAVCTQRQRRVCPQPEWGSAAVCWLCWLGTGPLYQQVFVTRPPSPFDTVILAVPRSPWSDMCCFVRGFTRHTEVGLPFQTAGSRWPGRLRVLWDSSVSPVPPGPSMADRSSPTPSSNGHPGSAVFLPGFRGLVHLLPLHHRSPQTQCLPVTMCVLLGAGGGSLSPLHVAPGGMARGRGWNHLKVNLLCARWLVLAVSLSDCWASPWAMGFLPARRLVPEGEHLVKRERARWKPYHPSGPSLKSHFYHVLSVWAVAE